MIDRLEAYGQMLINEPLGSKWSAVLFTGCMKLNVFFGHFGFVFLSYGDPVRCLKWSAS